MMTSLKLMRPLSIPLGTGPHPIFTSCSTPYQVHIACIQAKMLVSTYQSCFHIRHWQHSPGACKLPNCNQYPGDLLHIFKSCSYLKPIVLKYLSIAKDCLNSFPFLMTLFSQNLAPSTHASLQFLLDPSTYPVVAAFPPHFKKIHIPLLFKASRTLIWPIHQHRL